MQSSSNTSATAAAGVQPEAILEWLQKEMGYRRPSGKSLQQQQPPTADSFRRICRGNMIPVWAFLLKRVKSEKTVEGIRKNITVHGGGMTERRINEQVPGGGDGDKEAAIRERDAGAKEVERLSSSVRRQRKELKARMLDVCREEAERKRMLDERSKNRHKQVMLEAYDQQCDESSKVFAEYHKRLCHFVNQARDCQRTVNIDASAEVASSFLSNNEKESAYSTVKGSKSADDVVLIETTPERNIRKACEYLAWQTIDRIRFSFPAYEGNGIHSNASLEAAKLGIHFDGEAPQDIQAIIANCLKNPNLLLVAISAYTLRLKILICREIEKIDVKADAETLRYKYENDRVMDASSPDGSSTLLHQLYGTPGNNVPSGGTQNQLLERQKAHVQQFLATEDARNRAAEARDLSQKLIQRLHGNDDAVSSHSLGLGGASQNITSLRQFELEVWAKEREVVGLRASLNTLMSEIQRLNKLCGERKEAEDSLRKKWKKIEEFDARRSELETIYNSLLKANNDAAAFWDRQPLAAREFAAITIIPACRWVIDIANKAKDLIDNEVEALARSPDNSLYMFPSTPQALLEFMGSTGTGPEAITVAERNASLLTARAGARDLSAIPSISRVSAALQYPSGLEGSDASLASLLESLEFCLKLRGSEASVLEDLSKAVHLVDVRQDLVQSGHSLLNQAYRAQQEYERTTSYCLNLANDQEKAVVEKWVPELKTAAHHAQSCLGDCEYVKGLLMEWWEQPASTVVDWVKVDGQNVTTWHNHVKQLLAYYDKK